jgi:SAM-dependent methyltransferase
MGIALGERVRIPYSGHLRFMERNTCPSCDGTRVATIWMGRFVDEPVRGFLARHDYAADPETALDGARFRLVRCEGCSLLYHAYVLDDEGMSRLYGSWIDDAQIERFEATHEDRENGARRFEDGRQLFKHMLRLHRLAGTKWPFRLLDFGCGDGRALRMAHALGFEAHGVDSSSTRNSRARRNGLEVHTTIEQAVTAVEGSFDAVTMMEVLEHLASPKKVLATVVRALRPGGVVLIEVPDARGIDGAPSSFEQMRVVHPLEHINAFTPATLDSMAREVGLVPAPRIPAHATTSLVEVLRTAMSRFVPRHTTSRYFVKL